MSSRLSIIYRALDKTLSAVATVGSTAMLALVCITVYDVMTRYFCLPKFQGLNSTMLQEAKYWAHTVLFTFVMAYAFTRQSHVRIDLVRDVMPRRIKYALEIFGLLVFLVPFAAIAVCLFSGFPVAFILGGVGLSFAFIALLVDPWLFDWPQFNAIPARVYGSIAENLILTAIPMFIFMVTMLEKSGIAKDLLNCLQYLQRRVPGGLALSVVMMGTILAATTDIVGASVVMMSLLALPVMMQKGYSPALASGTIAASGTLGILIPPSIMLVIMADLLSKSVGNLLVAAIVPGFMLAGYYMIYIVFICWLKPELAPKPNKDMALDNKGGVTVMVLRSFVPPVVLIMFVLGCILGGLATPTEAASMGAAGAILLGLFNLVILPKLGVQPMEFGDKTALLHDAPTSGKLWDFCKVVWDVVRRSALTNAMIFGIFIGATLFSMSSARSAGKRS